VAELNDTFYLNGLVGGLLKEVIQDEHRCKSEFSTKYHGHRAVMDSFHSFFIESPKRSLFPYSSTLPVFRESVRYRLAMMSTGRGRKMMNNIDFVLYSGLPCQRS
jgi:hypothetical protein